MAETLVQRGLRVALVLSVATAAVGALAEKPELFGRQREQVAAGGDPFGGFSAIGWRALGLRPARKVFQSPGPIYEPESGSADGWRLARAMFVAGFRAGDLVHNSFSYHLTPAGSMMEGGAHRIGLAFNGDEIQRERVEPVGPHACARLRPESAGRGAAQPGQLLGHLPRRGVQFDRDRA